MSGWRLCVLSMKLWMFLCVGKNRLLFFSTSPNVDMTNSSRYFFKSAALSTPAFINSWIFNLSLRSSVCFPPSSCVLNDKKQDSHIQSPTQWSPLTSRINLCKHLTVLQDSCKTHLRSRFCFLEAIFRLAYIFSCDIKYDIIRVFEMKLLFEIGYIYRNYIVVYLF